MQGFDRVVGDKKQKQEKQKKTQHLKVQVGANDYRAGGCHNSLVSKEGFLKLSG